MAGEEKTSHQEQQSVDNVSQIEDVGQQQQQQPMDTANGSIADEDLSIHNSSSYGPKVAPPITLLQEICSRNGFTTEYQLLSTEGSVHEPTFKIAVTVADITVTASGQSKKKARHAAAREAIEKLRQRSNLNFDGLNLDSMASINEPTDKSVYAAAANETNPVGKLQEICMKMRVNPPDYDTCAEKGLAHERIFMLSCSINSLNLTTCGEGRSKKLAKRQAAEHMLALLERSEIYDKSANTKTTDFGASSLNMDNDDNSHFVRTRRFITELCSQLDYTVSDLWGNINMIETDDVNEDLFYELFQETLSSIGHCQFNYLTDTDCILHVCDPHDNILMTSYGSGVTNIVAMKNSVINAYKLMIVLMKPLTGRDSHQIHQDLVETSNQVVMET